MSQLEMLMGAAGVGGGASANYIEDVFSTYLYTGNGTSQSITNNIDESGKGALTWIKARNEIAPPTLFDTVRGVSQYLNTNSTAAQYLVSGFGVTAFNNNGFTVTGPSGYYINTLDTNYASWTFAEQEKFFDVVTYTGTGSATTIAHNLGSEPGMIIVKATSTTTDWAVYHRSAAASGKTAAESYLRLNLTNAVTDNAVWNNTAPTSTVFSVGSGSPSNSSGQTYVAYLFAHDAGGFGTSGTDNVISCGSFTTDGSGNATVSLGYEPQYLMFKASSATGNWFVTDVMRGFSKTSNELLQPNTSGAEFSAVWGSPTATGFTFDQGNLAPSTTFIYMAIRRPMKPPTVGTQVFSPSATSGGDGTTITTGFPVDMQIWRGISSVWTLSNTVVDRLRGNSSTLAGQNSPYLLTSSTATESTAYNNTQLWSNIGFNVSSSLGGVNSVYYNFSRRPGFFDEVCYAGNSTAGATQAHNLGAVPELMLIKARNGTNAFTVYSAATGNNKYLLLNNNTDGALTSSNQWNNTTPTSSVFSLGTDSNVNNSIRTYVAYLFATLAGVSKVGSYTGNGSTQAIACGFTGGARFVLIRRTDAAGDWYVYDTARGMTLLTDPYLLLNSTAAETATLGSVTTTTGGFTVDATILAAINTNAASYLFLAIA